MSKFKIFVQSGSLYCEDCGSCDWGRVTLYGEDHREILSEYSDGHLSPGKFYDGDDFANGMKCTLEALGHEVEVIRVD